MRFIQVFLCLFVFSFLFFGFFHAVSLNQDLGRHLKLGEIILETKSIPKTNLFSYTYPDFPFINSHWLSEVVFYVTHDISGFAGLLFLNIIAVLIAFGLIFFYFAKKTTLASSILVSALYIPVLLERTEVRPEIFSFLFLSMFMVILYKNREKFTKLVFFLPLIQLLWTNMHISFLIGILVLGVFVLEAILKNRTRFGYHYTSILVVFILVLCSAIINPHGIQGALYPLNVFQNYGYSIEENQNVFFLWQLFQKPTIAWFFTAAVVLIGSFFLNLKRIRAIDIFLSILFLVLGTMFVRNLPLFVFGTFFACSYNLSFFFKNNHKKSFLFLIFTILFLSYTTSPLQNTTIGFGVEESGKNSIDFFLKKNVKGPIFNNFDIGSYIAYRLFPSQHVFIDGRPEAYPASFFQETYIPMQENPLIFEEKSKEYQFNTIYFNHTDQTPWAESFLKQIFSNPDWKLIYLDDFAVIFVKDPATPPLNNLFTHITSGMLSDYDSLIRLAHLFQILDVTNEQEEIYKRILSIKPDFCPALYNYSVILRVKNNPAASVFSQRYQVSCL